MDSNIFNLKSRIIKHLIMIEGALNTIPSLVTDLEKLTKEYVSAGGIFDDDIKKKDNDVDLAFQRVKTLLEENNKWRKERRGASYEERPSFAIFKKICYNEL